MCTTATAKMMRCVSCWTLTGHKGSWSARQAPLLTPPARRRRCPADSGGALADGTYVALGGRGAAACELDLMHMAASPSCRDAGTTKWRRKLEGHTG